VTLKFILLEPDRYFAAAQQAILSLAGFHEAADFLNFDIEFFSLQFSER